MAAEMRLAGPGASRGSSPPVSPRSAEIADVGCEVWLYMGSGELIMLMQQVLHPPSHLLSLIS